MATSVYHFVFRLRTPHSAANFSMSRKTWRCGEESRKTVFELQVEKIWGSGLPHCRTTFFRLRFHRVFLLLTTALKPCEWHSTESHHAKSAFQPRSTCQVKKKKNLNPKPRVDSILSTQGSKYTCNHFRIAATEV